MKIGVLGAGMIGGTLGRLWLEAGHEVRFATRRPDEVAGLLGKLGPRASASMPAGAVEFGEALLLAVPLLAVPQLGRDHAAAAAGKTVLDATNPSPQRDGEVAVAAQQADHGSSAWVASQLGGAQVVKAFNTVYFKLLASEAHRRGDLLGIPLASDHPAALEVAARLVRDAGFEPVIAGPLAEGAKFEPGSRLFNTGMSAAQLRGALGSSRVP
jgi:predicted dinucleotide-binding enzyme